MTEPTSLRRPRPRPEARFQLVCLPHAGGSYSVYTAWAKRLPPEVELIVACYPGRVHRIGDPWPASIAALAADLAADLRTVLDRPWLAFGHSMGASVAYELALALGESGNLPERLFVSAREAPDCPAPRRLHQLDDDELCKALIELGGTEPELLELPQMRSLILPVVRGDYRLLAEYTPRPDARLTCPVTAFTGRADDRLSPDGVARWREWTSGPFDSVEFSGDHFYLFEETDRVIGELTARLPARA
ncbi:alpha/beta fold hydrolase [Streptomyces sp. NPDC020362]|uniref:thioesterase II family protein n=1 Tax=unclassified Streptomyces TaxID=2593676 RepID=UPI000A95F4A5